MGPLFKKTFTMHMAGVLTRQLAKATQAFDYQLIKNKTVQIFAVTSLFN